MNHADTPVYQTVIEKSRGLLFRSQAIASAIEIRAGASFLPALSLFLLVQIANYLELLIAAGGAVDRDQHRVGGRGGRGGRGGARGGGQTGRTGGGASRPAGGDDNKSSNGDTPAPATEA